MEYIRHLTIVSQLHMSLTYFEHIPPSYYFNHVFMYILLVMWHICCIS